MGEARTRETTEAVPVTWPTASQEKTTARASGGAWLVRMASRTSETGVVSARQRKSGLMRPPAVSEL